MASHEFEKVVEKACNDLEIPGAALLATNRDGTFTYSSAFGSAGIDEDGKSKPYQLDTVAWIASCTKLLTSLAALHLVANQNLSLDDPTLLETHLPELTSKPIVQPPTSEGAAPGTTPRTAPLTLRHLLTHTSGLVYDQMNPLLATWAAANNKPRIRGTDVISRYDSPLAFEPGTSWMYGPSIDYAGLLIERVSGSTLESYMHTHIFSKVDAKDLTFRLSTRPDLQAKMADMSFRTKEGKVSFTPESAEQGRKIYQTEEGGELEGNLGGEGVFATAADYIKVLRGVLDGSVIPDSLAEEVFKPQLGQTQADALNGLLQLDIANNAMGHTRKNVRKNWGLAGLLLDADDHEKGRKEGTLIWAGLPMLSWFVDRKAGLCGFFGTQVLPTGDQKAADLMNVFVDGLYELYSSSAEGKGHL